MLLLDALLFAACLLTFAYFHHVRPLFRADIPVMQSAELHTAGDFSDKWPDMFTDGAVELTEDSYRSKNISLKIKRFQAYSSTVCAADIYIRRVDCFQAAFANDTFPGDTREKMPDFAARKGAVLAINGDYCGGRETGVIIRNGKCWRDVPRSDVGALYADGSMRLFAPEYWNTASELGNGAFQSFSFGPILVQGGIVQSTFHLNWAMYAEQHPRSAIGYYEPGHYCLVTVDGRGMGGSEGVTNAQLADIMGNNLGCVQAFGLDGGKTSQMWFAGEMLNLPDGYDGTAASLRSQTDIFYLTEVSE